MEYSFGSLWDDVPAPLTAEALRREAAACPVCRGTKWITTVGGNYPCDECHQTGQVPDGHVVRSSRKTAEAAPEGSKIKKVGDEWVLYHPNGREIARSKDKKLLTDYRDDKTSAKVATRIRVTQNCQNDEGYLFWAGEEFEAMSGGPYDYGVEVKTRGDYTSIPPGNFEVVGSKTAAKPKGNRAPDEPIQQPMRPTNQIRQSPSADQIKARKQMSRKQATGQDPDQRRRDDREYDLYRAEVEKTLCPACAGTGGPGRSICPDCNGTGRITPTKESARKQAGRIGTELPCGCDVVWHMDTQDYDDSRTCPNHTLAEAIALANAPVTPTKESAMRTEAQILREMATASLADQRVLAQELDTLRHQRSAALQADRDLDLADTIVRAHLTPVRVHAMHTTATDWVDTEEPQGDPTLAMKTEATLWFQRTSAEVRDDLEEFAIQAQGKATQLASRHGEQADVAFEAFIGHVDHLYRQASKVAAEGPSKEIDKDQQSGDAMSGLPLEVDNDETAFDDPGFLNDDEDHGVHPKMPGAGQTASKTAAESTTCADCGNPVVKKTDPTGQRGEAYAETHNGESAWGHFGTDPRSGTNDWDFNCGMSEDGLHHPKTASLHTAGDVPQAFKDQWGKGNNDDDDSKNDTPANLGKTDGDPAQVDTYDNDDDDDKKTSRRHTAADGQTCADCGSSIEHDPANEDPSTWHHNDGSSHDHEATPKSASKTAAEDWKCEICGKDAPVMKSTRGEGTRFACYDHEDDLWKPKADTKESRRVQAESRSSEDNKASQNGDANSSLPEPDNTKPYLEEDWDHESEDPETGTGAADVKNAKNPNDHSSARRTAAEGTCSECGHSSSAHNLGDGPNKGCSETISTSGRTETVCPCHASQSKTSMLDKAAAFRATVQANLAKI